MKRYKYAYIGVNDSGKSIVLDKYKFIHQPNEIHCFIEKSMLYESKDLFRSRFIRVVSGNSSLTLLSFFDLIQFSEKLFLLGGLGAKTGNRFFPVLSRMLAEKNAYFKCIVNTPFSFEGKNRNKQALKVVREMSLYCEVKAISLQTIIRKYGKVKIGDAFTQLMIMYLDYVI